MLDELYRDRQAVEDRILRAAIAEVEDWPEAKRRRRAYVVWGDDWHEGVIGIVASRLVERYHRPVVLIAGTDALWKGSGRSIPAFDLHSALDACSGLLERFGGHRAAAGLSIRPESIERFAEAFAARAELTLPQEELTPTTVVDAVLPRGARLTLDLCQELGRLAPFGLGNPDVTLLAPGCELGDLATVGDGKHLRFRVQRGGHDAGGAIAFGQGTNLDRYRRQGRYDVAFRLQENHWNGTVAPQLVVRRVFDADDRFDEVYDWLRTEWQAERRTPQAQRIFDELEVEQGGPKRHPLESETFRALLAEPALLRAA
jgi:single-stranded-DNA-specific exonuclease